MQNLATQLNTPHLGVHLWLSDESPLEIRLDSSILKDTKKEASAAGSLFQSGIVHFKKLYLKQSVDVEYC